MYHTSIPTTWEYSPQSLNLLANRPDGANREVRIISVFIMHVSPPAFRQQHARIRWNDISGSKWFGSYRGHTEDPHPAALAVAFNYTAHDQVQHPSPNIPSLLTRDSSSFTDQTIILYLAYNVSTPHTETDISDFHPSYFKSYCSRQAAQRH
ncbi:hypothetical protein MRB53_039711 [Persea americana]|nr:hypothetical protein MRB53_039711 [Persea americana]